VDKVDNMVLISSDNATKLDNLPTLEEYNNTIQSLQESINTNNDSISELQSNKVDVVSGKGLSTNDYTNDDKNALSDLLKRVAELEEAVTKLTAINTFNVKLDS
jgi:prefoldin subunit 5